MERKATIRHSYEVLALSIIVHAVDDYHRGYEKDCLDFLFSDMFCLCCSMLDLNEEKARSLMMKNYKNPKRISVYRMLEGA